MTLMKGFLLAGALVMSTIACRTLPETGRRQVLLVSASDEQKMGLTAYEDVLKTAKLSVDKEKIAQVERVGRRIARAANRPDFKWEFKVIDDEKTINAFCLPGGKIAVYTGLLTVTKTDAGLAAVMGHEVAHATLRHGGERVSQAMLAGLGDQALAVAFAQKDPKVVSAVRGAYGLGAQVGVLLPFSREHESEADKVGLEYMAKAGYQPHEAIDFWKRMAAASGGSEPPEFLSTHPANSTRVQNLQKWLPKAQSMYKPQ